MGPSGLELVNTTALIGLVTKQQPACKRCIIHDLAGLPQAQLAQLLPETMTNKSGGAADDCLEQV